MIKSFFYLRISLLSSWDILIIPVLFFLMIAFTFWWKERFYKNNVIGKYILPALLVRMIGMFSITALYQFYYNGGDTFSYYGCTLQIWEAFVENPLYAFDIIFFSPENYHFLQSHELATHHFFERLNIGLVGRIGGFFGLFTFGSYLAVSAIVTYFSFLGCWKIFLVFYERYSFLHKKLAYACLFFPSVCFWGTGLLKDSICLAALGFLFWNLNSIFAKGDFSIRRLMIIIFCSYLIISIKIYIILCFLPAYFIWIIFHFRSRIKNRLIRVSITPLLFVFMAIGGIFTIIQIGQFNERYNVENTLQTAATTYNYIQYVSEEKDGSGYDLGTFEPTIASAITFFPKAVNVTLFRPYLWEAKKIINIPLAIESLGTLIVTLWVLYHVKNLRVIRLLMSNKDIVLCFVFSIIFAFAVGLATGNFGSLARYKIPCLPFYFVFLILIYEFAKKRKRAPKLE